jgi:ligand-binding sensor domain-containing protein
LWQALPALPCFRPRPLARGSDHAVTCLLEDRDGNLWFGTMTSGVYRHDARTGELTNFLNNQQFNLRDRYQLILDIHKDRSGNMWFTSWNGGGAWRLGTDGKTFRQFLPSADYYQVKDGFSESVSVNCSIA